YPLFSVLKSCSRVFAKDIYGDHVVSCAGIIAGKEVDIGLDGRRDKPLRPTRKRGKYMVKCATIGYGVLPFSFSFLGELEADAVTLLKQIRKFSMAQDIGARAVVHIFNRISFAITK
ncbi:hypothetical protein Tco_1478184, partial [Tanacetum coccineum]